MSASSSSKHQVLRLIPNSVKAKGKNLMLLLLPLFKMSIWHLESSSLVTSNIKSSPSKRFKLLLTERLGWAVSTPYSFN
jgi:hypothetical protein